MNAENDQSGVRAESRVATRGRRSGAGLRLVASRKADFAMQPRPIKTRLRVIPAVSHGATTLSSGTYDIHFTSMRRPGAAKDFPGPGHQEGMIMEAFERLIGTVGRFAVGFGCGLALVCAFVVVTTDLGDSPKAVRPEGVVRLDPVVVTISAERFAEVEAELHGAPVLVRTPDHGASQG